MEHEGEVLLVRSVGWPESWYGLVTGFLERDEEPEAAVLREVREELGLEARVVAPIGVYTFPERNELILAYHVEARGEVRLGEELAGLKRIRPEKLCPWAFATRAGGPGLARAAGERARDGRGGQSSSSGVTASSSSKLSRSSASSGSSASGSGGTGSTGRGTAARRPRRGSGAGRLAGLSFWSAPHLGQTASGFLMS